MGHLYLINPAPAASPTQVTTKLFISRPIPLIAIVLLRHAYGPPPPPSLSSSYAFARLLLGSFLGHQRCELTCAAAAVGLNLICCFACDAVCSKQIYGVASAEGAINCVYNNLIAIACCRTQERIL